MSRNPNRAPAPSRRRLPTAVALATLLVLSISAAPVIAGSAAVQEQRVERRTFSGSDIAMIDLESLVGEVRVEGGASGDIEVVATIRAESGDRADAQTLLNALEIEFDEDSRSVDIEVLFPVDRFDTYRYPGPGRGTYNTTTTYRGERVRVTSRDDDDAVALWVDFEIRVPDGVEVDIENNVGDVSATGVNGDFSADTGSGDITVIGGSGELMADTGSGDVVVNGYDGDIDADTGSGDVEIEDVSGDVVADTGSGRIMLTDVRARRVVADTGSGDIELENVSGSVNADTGSGDITGRNLSGARTVVADTGSGDVRLSGDMSQADQIEIDTSSGTVELLLDPVPGMRITIETGSGNINVDLPGLQTIRSRRSYFRGEVGDGRTEVTIDTGSGSVRVGTR